MSPDYHLPDNHPEAAFAYDRLNHSVRLNNGLRVPIVRYHDEDEEQVQPTDLDLYDVVQAIYGPLTSGDYGIITLARQSKH